jgi:hypothetical protein
MAGKGDNIEMGDGDFNNTSCNFFFTRFEFEPDGTFVSVGAYE